MDNDFQNFLQLYVNGNFQKLVKPKTGKISFDFSTPQKTSEFLETFETEILNCNINLLYAYHQWLNNQK